MFDRPPFALETSLTRCAATPARGMAPDTSSEPADMLAAPVDAVRNAGATRLVNFATIGKP